MHNHQKYLTRIQVETATPMRVGSGNAGLLVDQLVARDANNLPYIPGTSLAGVIRHELSQYPVFTADQINRLFGFQNPKITDKTSEKEKGQGSRILFSPALLLSDDGSKVHEGLEHIDFEKAYYKAYQDNILPERDHVRMSHKGVAMMYGKYEEQVVYQGTRFVFEMELAGTEVDEAAWKQLLTIIQQPTFRIGAGIRKGFGALKVIKMQQQIFDLMDKNQLEAYLNISSSLNDDFSEWEEVGEESANDKWKPYEVNIRPENFFLFGSGLQDAAADETPKTEKIFKWENDKAVLSEEQLLIPATSVKGALAHRVAFHYNRLVGVTIETADNGDWGKADLVAKMEENLAEINLGTNIDSLTHPADSDQWNQLISQIQGKKATDDPTWKAYAETIEQKKGTVDEVQVGTGALNKAVVALFGKKAELKKKGKEMIQIGQRGNVIFSDIFVPKAPTKVFNHVAIDRFTGGGIDGALFQERVTTAEAFPLKVFVNKAAFEIEHVQNAFEAALEDLKKGDLQLGGHTTKGHGVFLES